MPSRPRIAFFFLVLLALAVACGSTSSSSEPTRELPDLGTARFGDVNEAQLAAMVDIAPEDDGPFHMVNLVKYREKADYADGRETDLTGREADALYAPLEFLEAIGAEVVFLGEVEDNLISIDGILWDQVAIVRYPSRAKFFEMTANEEFRARAVHKDAGLEKSLVIVSHLRNGLGVQPSDEVPNPATPDDPAVAIAHLLGFNEVADYGPESDEPERSGREAMDLYQEAATPVALEQGVNPIAWFDIEGVLIGDGREWDEFRINLFPSHAAFTAVVSDPTRLAGQVHREAALQDTYTTANAVVINNLGGDVGGAGGVLESCTPGSCGGDSVCCHDCADFAAAFLPFEDSACIPLPQTEQLTTTAMCTCD